MLCALQDDETPASWHGWTGTAVYWFPTLNIAQEQLLVSGATLNHHRHKQHFRKLEYQESG